MRKSLLLTLALIVVACSQRGAQTLLSVPENEADAAEDEGVQVKSALAAMAGL